MTAVVEPLDRACPTCSARPRARCTTPRGRTRAPHEARTGAAPRPAAGVWPPRTTPTPDQPNADVRFTDEALDLWAAPLDDPPDDEPAPAPTWRGRPITAPPTHGLT